MLRPRLLLKALGLPENFFSFLSDRERLPRSRRLPRPGGYLQCGRCLLWFAGQVTCTSSDRAGPAQGAACETGAERSCRLLVASAPCAVVDRMSASDGFVQQRAQRRKKSRHTYSRLCGRGFRSAGTTFLSIRRTTEASTTENW